eukprot:9144972-Pyramimonas_sp.AAC.1
MATERAQLVGLLFCRGRKRKRRRRPTRSGGLRASLIIQRQASKGATPSARSEPTAGWAIG